MPTELKDTAYAAMKAGRHWQRETPVLYLGCADCKVYLDGKGAKVGHNLVAVWTAISASSRLGGLGLNAWSLSRSNNVTLHR